MKLVLSILFVAINYVCYSQCDIKTTNRPDGAIIKYFTPKPVAKTNTHEAGLSLYYNVKTKEYTITLFLLYKGRAPKELNGNLILQTTNNNGISLKPHIHKLIDMNGNDVATSIFYLTERDINELRKFPLKTMSVNIDNKILGLTTTENKNLIIAEFACLN